MIRLILIEPETKTRANWWPSYLSLAGMHVEGVLFETCKFSELTDVEDAVLVFCCSEPEILEAKKRFPGVPLVSHIHGNKRHRFNGSMLATCHWEGHEQTYEEAADVVFLNAPQSGWENGFVVGFPYQYVEEVSAVTEDKDFDYLIAGRIAPCKQTLLAAHLALQYASPEKIVIASPYSSEKLSEDSKKIAETLASEGFKVLLAPKDYDRLCRRSRYILTASLGDTFNLSLVDGFLGGAQVLAPDISPFYLIWGQSSLYPPYYMGDGWEHPRESKLRMGSVYRPLVAGRMALAAEAAKNPRVRKRNQRLCYRNWMGNNLYSLAEWTLLTKELDYDSKSKTTGTI